MGVTKIRLVNDFVKIKIKIKGNLLECGDALFDYLRNLYLVFPRFLFKINNWTWNKFKNKKT